jgi:hypothetical protein
MRCPLNSQSKRLHIPIMLLCQSAEKAPTPRRPSLAEIIPDWPILQPFNREEVPLNITSIIFFFLDF